MSLVGVQVPEAGLKISAPGYCSVPPATSTRPSDSTDMAKANRVTDIEGAADQVPEVGLKISADDRRSLPSCPPATRTLPSRRSAAAPEKRGEAIDPAGDH